MSEVAAKLRLVMADQIGSPGWRRALEVVPRELFLGDAVYLAEEGRADRWNPVRRAEMEEEGWLALAYTDATWVTQVEGVLAENATDVIVGQPSSSSTFPSLVVLMLEAAQISEGDTVLEIGTGTGYSTSLMCERLGQEAVTSVEYDPEVAVRARKAITEAGYTPTLAVQDGLFGYGSDDEYDRLIATCSVRTIPAAWMRQVRSGGTITAPMWGWMGGVAFAHLTLADDGSASGRFLKDDLYFMTARSHLPPPRPPVTTGFGEARRCRIDPSILRSDDTAVWIAQLATPQAQLSWSEESTLLLDVGTGSRADTAPDPAGGWTVYQHGPIKLWDKAEEAVLIWQEAGSPHQSGFGLTVTRERQRVWLGDPAGPSWDLPA
ncbi:ATP-grasp peptide maturase system methyltransferase [Streptosporangium sp. NPDC049046]|uniref:ATP-grasp peptide maturase system methyltransferase n=1 Tax=unclassified Streptosporangium TaxID=2632669 RepID=UPI00341E7289